MTTKTTKRIPMHLRCALTADPQARYWHPIFVTPPQTGRLGRVVCLEDVLSELLRVLDLVFHLLLHA